MSYYIRELLAAEHSIKNLALQLRHLRLWEAARQLETVVPLVEKEIELETTKYERGYEK